MFDIRLNKIKTILLLALIFTLGLVVRLLYFDNITFGWDQSRDALKAINIWKIDPIQVIGPSTDLQGLNHGVMYWYLISPFYYFSKGNIYVVKSFLIFYNLICIFVLYYVAKKMFNNMFIALFASFMFAVSFEAVQYGRWLSNPSPAVLTTLVSLYGLWLVLKGVSTGFLFFFVSWALSVHYEFFLVYQPLLLVVVLFYRYSLNKNMRYSLSHILIALSGAIVVLLPFLVSELKFGLKGIRALTDFLREEKAIFPSFIQILSNYIDKLAQLFFFNFFGINILLAGSIFIMTVLLSVYLVKKHAVHKDEIFLLCVWLCSPLFLASFEKNNSYFLMLGTQYSAILLLSYVLAYILNKNTFPKAILTLFISIILISNIKLINTHNKNGEVLFTAQQKMIYAEQKEILDWVYKDTNGKKFGINTVTNPLFINTTWAFLFDSYGKRTYGYMPVWLGYPQEGVVGEEIEYNGNNPETGLIYYLIIEPPIGISESYLNGYPIYEDTRSKLLETQRFGDFIVQKRRLTKVKHFSRDELYKIITTRKL